MTPEHDKRETGADEPLHPEVLAAYNYVEGMDEADVYLGISPFWSGWALREAFLAGITYAQQQAEKNN